MNVGMKRYLVICAATLACSAGCAKQGVVKQDQVVPPTASAPKQVVDKAPVEEKAEAKDAGIGAGLNENYRKAPAAVEEASLKDALDKVFFDFDSSNLTERARTTLAKNADLLKRDATAKIRIEGNCDERGSDDYNLALGERRAKAAKEYLQNLGVAANRLTTISYGKEKPAVPGHDEAAMSKNRRDEFVITN